MKGGYAKWRRRRRRKRGWTESIIEGNGKAVVGMNGSRRDKGRNESDEKRKGNGGGGAGCGDDGGNTQRRRRRRI